MPISLLPGQVVTTPDVAAVAAEAATRLGHALREAIATRGAASIALSGGNTPRPAYEQLARETNVDWSKVSVFWIDERAVPPTHARSNYRLAKESLLDRVPILPVNVHRMHGDAESLEQAARDYAALLTTKLSTVRVGTIDVPVFDAAVLGIGDDGHTASLFPGEASVEVRDRVVLSIAAAPKLAREARLTVTTPVIEQIRTALYLVTGKAKRGPLDRVSSTTGALQETPSRISRGIVGKLVWILDDAAAGVE